VWEGTSWGYQGHGFVIEEVRARVKV